MLRRDARAMLINLIEDAIRVRELEEQAAESENALDRAKANASSERDWWMVEELANEHDENLDMHASAVERFLRFQSSFLDDVMG